MSCPKMMRGIFAFLACCFSANFAVENAQAHGYPPFGAWVYGSGYSGYTVARSRTVVRSRPTVWHGWGGYGNYGFAATTRIHTRYRHYPAYTSFSYRVGYPRYYRPFVYSYVAPVVRYYPAPVYYNYTIPTITYPVLPIIPLCSTTPNSLSVGYTALAKSPVSPSVTTTPIVSGSPQASPSTVPGKPILKLVGTNPEPAKVPVAILDAADAILKAGGYSEAAKAYAELSVRYGNTPILLERRFVAQVLSRNYDQAEIILQLAELSQTPITGESFEGFGFSAFLNAPIVLEASTEALAEHALSKTKDAVALRTVATWLTLAGNIAKANVFFEAAGRLTVSENLELPAPALSATQGKTELVSFE